MANLAALVKQRRFRGLLVGYPGAGKTGALACLANAGYRLRILDFDNNLDPLFEYVKPEFYENVEVVTLEDKMRMGPNGPEPVGKPDAFAKSLRLLDNWKYTDEATGSEVDLGPFYSWGERDILVGDSLSGMTRAAFRRVLHMNNRIEKGPRKQDWNSAVTEVNALLEKVTGGKVNANVIFTAHLTVVSPQADEKDDSELVKEIKEQVAGLLPARLFPAGVTKQHSRTVAEHFPALLLVETVLVNNKPQRVIRTISSPDLDLKLPVASLPAHLPQDTGLLTIFNKVLTNPASGLKDAA